MIACIKTSLTQEERLSYCIRNKHEEFTCLVITAESGASSTRRSDLIL